MTMIEVQLSFFISFMFCIMFDKILDRKDFDYRNWAIDINTKYMEQDWAFYRNYVVIRKFVHCQNGDQSFHVPATEHIYTLLEFLCYVPVLFLYLTSMYSFLLPLKDYVPGGRSSSRSSPRHVPEQEMGNSRRSRTKHMQKNFEAYEWRSSICQGIRKMSFPYRSWYAGSAERLKSAEWVGLIIDPKELQMSIHLWSHVKSSKCENLSFSSFSDADLPVICCLYNLTFFC